MEKIATLKIKFKNFKSAYKTEVSTNDKMSTKEIVSCGLLAGGENCLNALKTGFYNVFLATCLGIKATDIALLATILTIVGYIKEPITSLILDNTRTRWGRFKPYIVVCFPIATMLYYAFFLNPFTDATMYQARLVYLYIVEISASIIGGFSRLNYFRLCITRDDKEKNKFLSLSKVISSITGSMSGAMPIIMDLFGGMISLRYLFIIVASILFPISLFCVFQAINIKERVVIVKESSGFKSFKEFINCVKMIFKNKNMMILWINNFGRIFNYVADIACAYVFMYCYGLYSWQTVVWVFGGVSEWLLLIFGRKLIDKIGSKNIIIIYKLMLITSMLVLYFIGYGTSILFLLVPCFCRFFGASFEYLEPIADTMFTSDIWDHYEWKYGVRNEATTDLIKTYITMPITLVQPIVYAFVFNKIGFLEGENVVQSQATKDGLFFVYTIFIAIGFAIDIIPLLIIKLDKNLMQKVRKELKERNNAIKRANTPAEIKELCRNYYFKKKKSLNSDFQ